MNCFKLITLLFALAQCAPSFAAEEEPPKKLHPVIVHLLKTGNPNAVDEDGYSIVDWGITCNHPDIVQKLLDAKANPNKKNPRGKSPLHRAVECGSIGIVQPLLDAKAFPRIKNFEGRTPRAHVENFARLYPPAFRINYPDPKAYEQMIGILKRHEDLADLAAPNWQDRKGKTPLRRALENKNVGIILPLLYAKADPTIKAADGQTPREYIENYHIYCSETPMSDETRKIINTLRDYEERTLALAELKGDEA